MPAIRQMLILALTREYSILRDIYILIEELTWLTNQALEEDDTDQIAVLTGQRQQYNEFIKEREHQLRQTEEMLKNLLGWQHFSMSRLLTEVEDTPQEELGKLTGEIHNIICSLARMDMINYHLYLGKRNKEKERWKLDSLWRKAETAYLDYPQVPKLRTAGSGKK